MLELYYALIIFFYEVYLEDPGGKGGFSKSSALFLYVFR